MSLEKAINEGLQSSTAVTCGLDDPLHVVVERMKDEPCLVLSKDRRLVGIITAFDLL
jgi:hypothetical protein